MRAHYSTPAVLCMLEILYNNEGKCLHLLGVFHNKKDKCMC